ncbi:histone-lysine N-methyltransferase SUVR5 isoform X2 [Diospyros lotus]|uniref:histone-lysine N-methyltransferase SUVR5 isoform X2 n=1 Tax=Diospyros lotus TaxID=55363 RepID=UPI002251837B|nr:histone-lysine N-methyltransferase SUVR5 isoform X2 [Diospyros lotus]XP_052195622.1 histone-lysine N-methyltransferase SUVR5 isoform X2 [Diospyros lotus]
MEVLPCSGVHYVEECDGRQQDSENAFMYDRESNCVEHGGQVQVADVKENDLSPDVERAQEERQGEAQWTNGELGNSEGQCSGASYFEIEMEGQNISCDSHDSEDDTFNGQELSTETCLASETSDLILDANDNGLLANPREGESSLSESNWLERDEALAVWVKWRGKWQAGIRCARADWPLATLKAKPTHDRKKYLVIFFPRTRNYSWADVLLVRPINQFPEPIAYKTHKVGVKMVKDLTLACRFIMQKLAVGMLNIIDQHTKALVENARNVMVWKEFAMEASRCKSYSDLGSVLLKLQTMIMESCLNSDWLQHSFHSWAQRCQNANSAESVEMLKEELVDSILWDEVSLLPDEVVRPELVYEYKNWKHEVMKWFSISHPLPSVGDIGKQTSHSPLPTGLQVSRKRPKLEVRRAESHLFQVDAQGSAQAVTVEIDAGFFDGQGIGHTGQLETNPAREELHLEGTAYKGPPSSLTDKWGEIVVEAEGSEVIQSKDVNVTPIGGGAARKSLDPCNKNRQCLAFIEAKGRQCVRWANDGDVYCCVHLASRFVGNTAKAEASPPVDVPLCEGTTTLGTRCKHRSLYGSSFCKKHRPHDNKNVTSNSPNDRIKRKHEEVMNISDTTNCKAIVLVGEVETPLQVNPISVMSKEAFSERNLMEISGQSRLEYDGNEVLHCIGSSPQDYSNPCLEIPKSHSLYCEKHLPGWLKRARNGKSRVISKEVFIDLLKDCCSREQKLHLHQACEVFYRLFKSILSLRNPIPKEIQLQWAISEASKDVRIGELLIKLVCSEIERLRRLWGFDAGQDKQSSSHGKELVPFEEPVPVPVATDGEHDIQNTVKCKICSDNFFDDKALGAHWMDNHKKEAQWLFRGYVCAICLDSFTNKKVLEAHVQERHHVQFVEQCMLLQCIPCGGHFGNPEQLWLHVFSVHPDKLRMSEHAEQHNLICGEDSPQRLELGNSVSVDNKTSNSQGGLRKFICRFCRLKFDLLPDLGRHHQAAHMGPNSVTPRPPKRGVRFYAYRLKSGRLSRPKFRKGLGSVSYRIRNRGAASMKKRFQALNAVGSGDMKVHSHVTEAGNLGRLVESQCSAVAKILFSEIQITKPHPSNLDIITIARSSCCKVSLQTSLEEKYGLLPECLYLKAAKLCSEYNILVTWHKEGFVCPKGCKPISGPNIVSSLMPLSEDLLGPQSAEGDPAENEWEMDECHYVVDSRHFKHNPIQKTFILCDDISFGLESIPVICVVDEDLLDSIRIVRDSSGGQLTAYSMPWESFTYVRKPLLDRSLEAESLQLGCACPHSTCSPENCDHVYLFDDDYENAKDIYGKPMRGRFPYDEKGRIILEEGFLVYECNHICSCSRSCQNKVLQNGVQVKLEVFKTEKKGWAVRAREAILCGTFVCEYIGEIIDEQEANRRRDRYGGKGWGYFYDIDSHLSDLSRLIEGQVPYVIDAMNYGNVSRYLNHSCSPNLVSRQVLVETIDCQLAHIGLYASRDIAAGEELTYNFRYKLLPGEGHPCHCGASNCRGRLY